MTKPILNRKDSGFTIVELLIVIIVIGILAALVLVAYANVQSQARDTSRKANATSIRDSALVLKNGTSAAGAYPKLTNASGNTGFSDDINANPNVQLDSTLMATVNVGYNLATNVPTGGPTSTNPDRYLVQYCPTNDSARTATTATGFVVTYWQETKSGGAGTQTLSTGTGTGC